jgi:hypothetical protein
VRVRCSVRDCNPSAEHVDHALVGCHALHDDTTQFTGVGDAAGCTTIVTGTTTSGSPLARTVSGLLYVPGAAVVKNVLSGVSVVVDPDGHVPVAHAAVAS